MIKIQLQRKCLQKLIIIKYLYRFYLRFSLLKKIRKYKNIKICTLLGKFADIQLVLSRPSAEIGTYKTHNQSSRLRAQLHAFFDINYIVLPLLMP